MTTMIPIPYLVVLLVTCLHLTDIPAVDAVIGCFGDSVPEGGQSEVNCIFDKNIKQARLGYQVWKFPLNTTRLVNDTIGTKVLDCYWGPADKPDCVVKNGYEHTTKYGGCDCQVSLQIPSLARDQEGIYKCQLVTQNDIPSKPCQITIHNPEGDARPADTGPLHPVIDSTAGQWGIIGVVVAVLILCVIFIIFTVVYKRKDVKHKMNTRDLHATIEEQDQTIREVILKKDTKERGTEMIIDTTDRASNTDRVDKIDIGSNTDPHFTSSLNVGSSQNLGSKLGFGSTQSQQLHPTKKKGRSSGVEGLDTSPRVMYQPGLDETEEDLDVSGSLLKFEGGDDSVQSTPVPDDDGQEEDTPLSAEQDGTRGENGKKSGKKKGGFWSRRSKSNKD